MAKKDNAMKAMKAAKTRQAKASGGGMVRYRKHIFSVFGLLMAMVMLASAFLLLVALMPTFVAFFVDGSKRKMKAVTVGVMNFAGASTYLFELWSHGNSFDAAVTIIADPQAIVVIYAVAAVGYFLDWALTGFFATFIVQRAKARMKVIVERRSELEARWGAEVSGAVPDEGHEDIDELEGASGVAH